MKHDETALEVDELSNIASALQKMLAVITELNEKILEELQEEEIEVGIPESDEYIFNLELKIQHVKWRIQTRTSKLNVHVQSFPTGQTSTASGNHSTNAQSFPPQSQVETCINLVENENEPPVLERENFRTQSNTSASATSSSVYHRLPKLDLPTFEGDVLEC